jgi:hypothetical protein
VPTGATSQTQRDQHALPVDAHGDELEKDDKVKQSPKGRSSIGRFKRVIGD